MDYRAWKTALASGAIGTVYLLTGTETCMKARAMKYLRAKCLTPGMEELDCATYENPSFDDLRAACETMPFMSPRRLVFVQNMAGLSAAARGSSTAAEDAPRVTQDAGQQLADYLPTIPATTCLVLTQTAACDTRRKAGKALLQMNAVVTFDPMDDAMCARFITSLLADAGKRISPADAAYLTFLVGRDGETLSSETEKLIGYTGAREMVTRVDMDAVCTPSLECTVFQMVDALVASDLPRALQLTDRMLKTGASRFALLAMILRQYRIMYFCKSLLDAGKSHLDVRQALAIAPFVEEQAARQARLFTTDTLKACVDLCVQTEYGLKNGSLQEETAFALLLFQLHSMRG